MSGTQFGILDPHLTYIDEKDQEGVQSAGKLFELKELLQPKLSDHLVPFEGIFGFQSSQQEYDATIFRFPLRQQPSDLSTKRYTPDEVLEELKSSFERDAKHILLFLKNVKKIGLFELIKGKKMELVATVSIDNVSAVIDNVDHVKKGSVKSFVHPCTTTVTVSPRFSPEHYHWILCHTIGSNESDIQKESDQLHVIPWVGVAVPLPIGVKFQPICVESGSFIENVTKLAEDMKKFRSLLFPVSSQNEPTFEGKVFCFLPFPQGTNLPVHVHGYFIPADDRQRIKWPSPEDKSPEARWNKLLMEKCLAPTYLLAIFARTFVFRYPLDSGLCNTDPFAIWPKASLLENRYIWSEFFLKVMSQIKEYEHIPLYWSPVNSGNWVSKTQALFVSKKNASIGCIALKLQICVVYLPDDVIQSLSASMNWHSTLPEMTPDSLLHILHHKHVSDIEQLTPEEKGILCKYLSSSSSLVAFLKSLPLFRSAPSEPPRFISCDKDVIFPDPKICFPKGVTFPTNILEVNSDNVKILARLLNTHPCSAADLAQYYILPFASTSLDTHECKKVYLWILDLLEENDEQLIQILRNKSFLSSSVIDDRKVYRPAELFHYNDSSYLKYFFSQVEPVYPHEDYKKYSSKLELLGIQRWYNIRDDRGRLISFLVDRSRRIYELSTRGDAKTISTNIVHQAITNKVVSEFLSMCKEIPFIFCTPTPPKEFEILRLPWGGAEKANTPLKPSEICFSSTFDGIETALVAGCVAPIVGREFQFLNISSLFRAVTADDVLDHLRIIISISHSLRLQGSNLISGMMHSVYKYFSKTDPAKLKNCNLPFFWSGSEFLPPTKVAYQSLPLLKPMYVSVIDTYGEAFLPFDFWQKCGIRRHFTAANCIEVLHLMNQRGNRLRDDDVSKAVHLLNHLIGLGDHTEDLRLLIPTQTGILLPPKECVYDDRQWTEKRQGANLCAKYNLVHKLVSEKLVQHFGVPALSSKIANPRGLKIRYTQKGQHESLTRRFKGIIEDYKDNIDVLKELIQNAEDAGASEVKFLLDWRQHPTENLFADGMKQWQGPALWAHNNSVFTNEDFESICEVAGATKMDDPSKIGRFGLGFCTVYHLTDLPMFISRDRFIVFDPHRENLTPLIEKGDPGVQFYYIEEKERILSYYYDQVAPFEGLFGCKIKGAEQGGYSGTLFRFPFRNSVTASRSSISGYKCDKNNYTELVKCLRDSADTLLIFLRNVRRVELYELHENAKPDQMQCILTIEKKWQIPLSVNFKEYQIYSPPTGKTVDSGSFSTSVTYWQLKETKSKSWLVTSALGIGKSLQFATSTESKHKGLFPLAEVAVPVSDSQQVMRVKPCNGEAFCFLPLSIPVDPIKCHVSGCFDIAKDRKSLRDMHNASSWNTALVSDALVSAFLELLKHLTKISSQNVDKKFLDSFYKIWPNGHENRTLPGTLISAFHQAIVSQKPKIVWSYCHSWLSLHDVKVLSRDFEHFEARVLQEAKEILVKNGHAVADIPVKLLDGLKSLSVPCQIELEEFWTCLIRNLHSLSREVVCSQMQYILVNFDYYTSHHTQLLGILLNSECIPCDANGPLHLLNPSVTIDPNNEHFGLLYDKSDGRFPVPHLVDDSRSHKALKELGMASKRLQDMDIIDRAKKVAALESQEKCMRMCENVLKYLEYHLKTFSYESHELLKHLLSISFLPVMVPPSPMLPWFQAEKMFMSQTELCHPGQAGLVFTFAAIVNPQRCSPVLMSSLQDLWKSVHTAQPVLDHFAKVVKWWYDNLGQIDAESVSFLSKMLPQLYEYLSSVEPKKDLMEKLIGNRPWIWQDGQFIHPHELVTTAEYTFPPYVQQLSDSNKKCCKFFEKFGVESVVNEIVALRALNRIAHEYSDRPLDQNLINFVNILASKIHKCPGDFVYLPDENGIMRPSNELAYRDNNASIPHEIIGKKMYFLHKDITRHFATNLGVKDLMYQLTNEMVDRGVFGGEDFGQHEDICDRLNGILTQYEPNVSIFREFVQNAEDAGATEIAFIIDRRTCHPSQRLFSDHENWKALQSMPSLLVFNNRQFTDEDIHGIAKVGVGGKRGQIDKIGRFGIGFNVAYHITDTPTLVSFGAGGVPEHFCLFDPNKACLPYNKKDNPGKAWKNKPDMKIYQYDDQLSPFLTNMIPRMAEKEPGSFRDLHVVENENWKKGYAMFRFPLTRASSEMNWKSKLTGCNMTVDMLRKLSQSLINEAAEMLLFLNNIRRISVFEISQNGEITHHSSTHANPVRLIAQPTPESFAESVKEAQSLMKKNQHPPSFSVVHFLKVTANNYHGKKVETRWLVSKRFGSTDLPANNIEEGYKQSLLPIAGVAASVGKALGDSGKVFVSLPLEDNPSYLPVHVNGHFWVDPSRKHLQHTKTEVLKDWNRMVATEIVARCYSNLLQSASKVIDQHDQLEWFHSLFPSCSQSNVSSSGKQAGAQSIKGFDVGRKVYEFLLKDKASILIAKQPRSRELISWLSLEDHEKNNKGYFFLSLPTSDSLADMLVQLTEKITDAPCQVYSELKRACPQYQGRVTPRLMAKWLKELAPKLDQIKNILLPVITDIWTYLSKDLSITLIGLPILLTQDGNLSIFQEPTFFPDDQVLALLPHRHCDFLSYKLRFTRFHNAHKPVDPRYVAQHIKLPKGCQLIPLDDSFKSLLTKFWKWIISNHTNQYFLACFKECTAIPTSYHSLVVPIQMADCVLIQSSKLEILNKIGVPIVDFSILGDDGIDSSTAMLLLKTVHVANEDDPLHVIQVLQKCRVNFPGELRATSMEVIKFASYISTSAVLLKRQTDLVDVLKCLPLYSILGTSSNIRRPINKGSEVYLIPDHVCQEGLLTIQQSSAVIFLSNDKSLPLAFLRIIGAFVLDVVGFYQKVIYCHLPKLPEAVKMKQIEYLTGGCISVLPSKDCRTLIEGLKSTAFIVVGATAKKVSEFFDPSEDFVSMFLHKHCHLPESWSTKKWLPVFRDLLGLQCLPTKQIWLEAVKVCCVRPDVYTIKGSNVLLNTFLRILKVSVNKTDKVSPVDQKFLQNVKTLPFVPTETRAQLYEVLKTLCRTFWPPPQAAPFSGSVVSRDPTTANIVGLEVNVVSASAHEISSYPAVCSALDIVPISVTLVCRNLLKLSEYLPWSSLTKVDVEMVHRLNAIFSQHYQYLLDQPSSELPTIKELISEKRCWLITENDRLVPVKVSEIVEQCSKEDVCLFPYLVVIPDSLHPYRRLMKDLGMEDRPRPFHYIQVLITLHNTNAGQELSSSNLDRAIVAYNALVVLLREKSTDDPDVKGVLAHRPFLRLPSNDGRLLLARDLVFSDTPRIQSWVGNDRYKFVHKPPMDMRTNTYTLPDCLGVPKLSTVVTEVPDPMVNSDGNMCVCEEYAKDRGNTGFRCEIAITFLNLIKSREFAAGLCRIIHSKNQRPLNGKEMEAVKLVQQLNVKCVKSIRTELHEKGKSLGLPQHVQYCSIYNNTMFVTFHPPSKQVGGRLILDHCTEQLWKILGDSVEPTYVTALLNSQPLLFEHVLDEHNLESFDGEVPITPGVILHPSKGSDFLLFHHFIENELVKYCQPDGTFVCGRIIKVVNSDGFSLPTVTINVSPKTSDIVCSPLNSLLICKSTTEQQDRTLNSCIERQAVGSLKDVSVFLIPSDEVGTWLESTLKASPAKHQWSSKQLEFVLERIIFHIHFLCCCQNRKGFKDIIEKICRSLVAQSYDYAVLSRVFENSKVTALVKEVDNPSRVLETYKKLSLFTSAHAIKYPLPIWDHLDELIQKMNILKEEKPQTNVCEADNWKKCAEKDLEIAEHLQKSEVQECFRAICFHSHEAVVKGIKAILWAHCGIRSDLKCSNDMDHLYKELVKYPELKQCNFEECISIVGKHGACCRQPDSENEVQHTREVAMDVLQNTKHLFQEMSKLKEFTRSSNPVQSRTPVDPHTSKCV